MQALVAVAAEKRREDVVAALTYAKESGNFGVRQLAEELLKQLEE